MTRATRSFSPAAVTYALLAAIYLAAWVGALSRSAHRGATGLDLERRGPQALVAVSMLDAAAALVVSPLVVLGARPRTAAAYGAAVFAITTAGAFAVAVQSTRVAAVDVASARLLLAAIAALAGAAAWLASRVWRDVYDAAAVVYLAMVLAVGGVVIAAPLLARLSNADTLIGALLAANPLVAMASATGFDVMRTEWLYRATPIGQRLFAYPSWYAAASLYAAAAAICLMLTYVFRSREARCV